MKLRKFIASKKTKLSKISSRQIKIFLFTFLFLAMGVANVLGVDASGLIQANPYEGSRDVPTINNSAVKNFARIIPPEEVAIISDGTCSTEQMGGLVPGSLEFFNDLTTVTGWETSCAKQALRNGDPSQFLTLMNRQDTSLVNAINQANSNLLDQRPVSGVEFLKDKAYAVANFGEVKAQDSEPTNYYPGLGFDLLRPVQAFWGWSVNIVYGIMILIIIAIAFAIMFRANLPGGAVVTLQNSIPNIALAMILIPLSYAITGLFIDGITLGTNVTHSFLLGPGAPARSVYENRDELATSIGNSGIGSVGDDRGLYPDDLRVSWLYASTSLGYQEELQGAFDGFPVLFGMGDVLESLISGLGTWITPILNFILGIILLLTGLRIFWLLVNKYIVFILGPLFAPFVFATIAIPGQGTKALVQYLKFMLSGTLFYIVAYAMILLSIIFSSAYFQAQVAEAGVTSYSPPLLGFDIAGDGGLVPQGLVAFYTSMISLVIFLNIPKALRQVDTAMGTETGVLPSFVKDSIESARQSINVGRQGVQYGGKIARAPGQGIEQVQRRAFGVNPEDYRSFGNIVGRRAKNLSANLNRRAEGIDNAFLRGVAKTGSRAVGGIAGGAANTVAGRNVNTNEADKPGSIEGQIQWNAGAGEFKFDDATVTQLMESSLSADVGPNGERYYALRGPKIVLQAKGDFLFPSVLNSSNTTIRYALQEGTASSTTGYRRRNVAGSGPTNDLLGDGGRSNNPIISITSPAAATARNPFSILFTMLGMNPFDVNTGIPHVTFEKTSYPAESDRKKVELSLLFRVPQSTRPGFPQPDGRRAFLDVIAKGFVKANEEITFLIDEAKSNPIAFRINAEFVNSGNRVVPGSRIITS